MFDTLNYKALTYFATVIVVVTAGIVGAIIDHDAMVAIALGIYLVLTMVMLISYLNDKARRAGFARGYDSGWDHGVHSGWQAAESGTYRTPVEYIEYGD